MYNLFIFLMTSSTQIILSKYNGKKSEDINIHIKVQLTFLSNYSLQKAEHKQK